MIRAELESSAWGAGCKVIAVEGQQALKMIRIVPRKLHLRCRTCGVTWWAAITKKAIGRRGWRNCPNRCNLAKTRGHR